MISDVNVNCFDKGIGDGAAGACRYENGHPAVSPAVPQRSALPPAETLRSGQFLRRAGS